MIKYKLIDILITIENVFCIYRNLAVLSKFWYRVAIVRIALMLILNVGGCIELVRSTCGSRDAAVRASLPFMYVFTLATTANAAAAALHAARRTRRFQLLLADVGCVHYYCCRDRDYNKRINNLRRGTFVVIGILIFFYLVSFITNVYQWVHSVHSHTLYITYSGIIHTMLSFWREIRFQFEFLTFNVFIRAITIMLSRLNARLLCFRERVAAARALDAAARARLRRDLDQWTLVYARVAACADGIEHCFGFQITFSLFILMVYLIGLSYNCVATTLSKAPGSAGMSMLLLVNYTLAVAVLCRAGQRARGAAQRLAATLAALHSTLLTTGAEAGELRRAVRGAGRAASARRLRVRVAARATLGMSLLLTICSSALSYTIVLLQFGHVV